MIDPVKDRHKPVLSYQAAPRKTAHPSALADDQPPCPLPRWSPGESRNLAM